MPSKMRIQFNALTVILLIGTLHRPAMADLGLGRPLGGFRRDPDTGQGAESEHDILDRDTFDLTEEQKFTRMARDSMWIVEKSKEESGMRGPIGSPRDIDLGSNEFKAYREQFKEVFYEDDDVEKWHEVAYDWFDDHEEEDGKDLWTWYPPKDWYDKEELALDEEVYGDSWYQRPPVQRRTTSSYFWRITLPGGVPSYILGSVRLPYTEVYPGLAENVKEAFEVRCFVAGQDFTGKGS